MSEKFTDEQIIEALKCCENESFDECQKCVYCEKCKNGGYTQVFTDALDLIHRQREEIERYKKFTEKVAQTICDNTYPDFDKDGKPVNVWKAREGYKAIDDLAKKMIEEATT